MSSFNRVILLGRLGADPELRTTQREPVCNLRLATTETWTDRQGQRQERTEWHSVIVWAKQAENCARYLSKGHQILVEGRLESREYTDKEGVTRRMWDIVATQVTFLGASGGGQTQRSGARAPQDG